MKIAIIYDWCYPFSKGGGESRYYHLTKELIKKGHEVKLFTLKCWDSSDKIITHNGIKYESIGKSLNAYNKDGNRSIVQSLYFGFKVLLNIHKFYKYDIIETAQYPFFHLFPLMIYRKILTVSWFEYWGNHWLEYSKNYIVARVGMAIEKITFKIPNSMIVISQSCHQKAKAVRSASSATYYIPNWIPDYNYKYDSTNKKLNNTICYFGRLKNHKNVKVLIEALKICHDKNFFYNLNIYGDGPDRKSIENLVINYNLQNKVKFSGAIEEHKDLLRRVSNTNLFVLPSTKEGGGSIVTLESNSVGVPVIAVKSDLGIDRSLIKDNYNGYWISACDPKEIADKIILHFQQTKDSEKIMKKNCKDFSRGYKIKYLIEDVLKVYKEVIK
jgi:glycosyltransferase involved in cell wall biosynthesis